MATVHSTRKAPVLVALPDPPAAPAPAGGVQTTPGLRTTAPDPREKATRARREALFDSPLPPRPLPPLALALRSPEVAAVPASVIYPPPPAVLDQLRAAKKVLVLGHVPPDADTLGSALGLRRLLSAMGKEAHVGLDAKPSGALRRLGEPGEVRSPDRLDSDYDLVVVVDVAQAARLGGCREALRKAPAVLVIDHHRTRPRREELGLAPGARLLRFLETEADAAALLVASLAEALGAEQGLEQDAWRQVMLPLAAGTHQDTDGFARPGASLPALQAYKHLVAVRLEGDAASVPAALSYALPGPAAELLARRAKERVVQGSRVVEIDQAAAKEALALAHLTDPAATMEDLRNHLLAQADGEVQRRPLSVLLFAQQEELTVSVRSRGAGPALELVEHLKGRLGGSGGGHLRVAAAHLPTGLARGSRAVRAWLGKAPLDPASEVQRRRLGSL